MKIKIILFALLLLAGCGGSGGGSSPVAPGTAPSISNLSYSPTSADVDAGGGAVTVTGSFDFVDIDGDLTTLYSWDDDENTTESTPIVGASGILAGSVDVIGYFRTIAPKTINFKVWVVDGKGNKSNELTGTFVVNI